jgi:quercetin dioxygenase-like cupin family protein
MWIEGIGEIELKEGVMVMVPRGVKHTGVYDVEEDIVCLVIFNPAVL